MFKTEQRVIQQGGSLLIVLPKIWREPIGIEKDDKVSIEIDNERLIIRPKEKEDSRQ